MDDNKKTTKHTFYLILICIFIVGITALYFKYDHVISEYVHNGGHLHKMEKKVISKKVVDLDTSKIKKIPPNFAGLNFSRMSSQEKMKVSELVSSWIYNNYLSVYKELSMEIAKSVIQTKFPFLLLGLIGAESSFRCQISSSAKAYGLCQIQYRIWRKESPKVLDGLNIRTYKELFDPSKNIKLAEYILLKYIRESNGNIKSALIRYQTGKKRLSLLAPKQRIRTSRYVSKVLEICGNVYVNVMLNLNKNL